MQGPKILAGLMGSAVLAVLLGWTSQYLMAVASTVSYLPNEDPGRRFYVAIVPGSQGAPFDVVRLSDLASRQGSILLPKDKDESRGFSEVNRYRVLERNGTEQLVELKHHDSDYDIRYIYRVSGKGITAVSRRSMGPGEAVMGGIAGIALTCFLWFLWFLRRVLPRINWSKL